MIEQPYILITCAVADELLEFVNKIRNPEYFLIGGKKVISGYIEEQSVKVLITGPGVVNCVQALTAMIERTSPVMIIVTGCGGAFCQSGLDIGDIGIASTEIDIHTGIENENHIFPLDILPFNLIETGKLCIKNIYPVTDKLKDKAVMILKKYCERKGIKVREGPFVTVSTITASNERANILYNHFNPIIEAMEGSGCAHVALHYNIEFLEIRAVSNMVGKRDISKWNLPLAFKHNSLAILQIVKIIIL